MDEPDPTLSQGGLHPDFQEEMAYFDANRVYALQIETTLACPQGCLYCYASANNGTGRELPAAAIRTVLEAAAGMGIRAIDWLGGDPLVRSDWHGLMQHARSLGMTNNIWSSGLPFLDASVAERAIRVSEGGFVSVHLDTLDEAIYRVLHAGDPREKIRGILRGVDNLIALGKSPDQLINCITLTRPLSDVERTIRYFRAEKEMRTCITPLVPLGGAADRPEWLPDIPAIRDACRARDRIDYAGSSLSMHAMDVTKFYCGGMVCITVDGDVTPCSLIRKGCGNVLSERLDAIVEENREDLLFIPLRSPQNGATACSRCSHGAVCWGCRAAAYYRHGSLLAEDPHCWMRLESGYG